MSPEPTRKIIVQEEFDRRLDETRKLLEAEGLDALLVYYDEYNLSNGVYLTDFWPQFESALVLVPRVSPPMILGGPENQVIAQQEAAILDYRNVPLFMLEGCYYPPRIEISSIAEIVTEVRSQQPLRRIGLVGAPIIPLALYTKLAHSLEEYGIEHCDVTGSFEALKRLRSQPEVEAYQEAYRLADRGLSALIDHVKVGETETSAAAHAELAMRLGGANGFGYSTVVCSGKRSRSIIGRASSKRFEQGDLVLTGASAKLEHYCSALGVPVIAGGEPSDEMRRFIEVGLVAYLRSIAALRPGVRGRDVDLAAREYISDHGLGDYHAYGVVHTIGTQEIEAPFFGPETELVLEPGNVISLDVGVFHPEKGGYRFEEGFAITDSGVIRFSEYMPTLLASRSFLAGLP